jgi:predicted NACHT family NTPase
MAEQSRVVVIGDPGSGKSTLLKHLALRLAHEDKAPLPILMPLNAYAGALAQGDRNLQHYLPEYFAGLAQGIAGLGPLFDDALATGRAVILLDGLDEVQRDRAHLVNKVEAFARDALARNNKIVVTSRIVGYRESTLDAHAWALYTLLDFDRAAIEQFAARWCFAFEKSTVGDTPKPSGSVCSTRSTRIPASPTLPAIHCC